jgi:hypothetical protein
MNKVSTVSAQPQSTWRRIAHLTAAATTLTGAQLAKTTAEAQTGYKSFEIPHDCNKFELRFRGDGSADDAEVVELYLVRGTDYYTRMVVLTVTLGTAVDLAGLLWADGVAEATDLLPGGGEARHDNNNMIGRYEITPGGYSHMLIGATTLNSTNLYVDFAKIE